MIQNETTNIPSLDKQVNQANTKLIEAESTNANNSNQLNQSRNLLVKLNTYSCCSKHPDELPDFSKEIIGFCTMCNKMIAMKYTSCSYCSKPYCKKHREAHQCESNMKIEFRSKLLGGKNMFMNKLKAAKVNAGK